MKKNIGNKVLIYRKNFSLHRKTSHSNVTWWNPELEISVYVTTAGWLLASYAISVYLVFIIQQ